MNIYSQNSIANHPFYSNINKKAGYENAPKRTQHQSFGGLEQIAEKYANKLVSSPTTQKVLTGNTLNKFLKMSIENPGLYEAFIALLVTCTARPLTILSTPGAKMEDKEYASAHSIASGISGLAFAYAAFGPITKAIDNILINVNGKNVQSAFESFYKNPENADLISKLVEHKIIPDKKTFDEAAQGGKNVFGFLKDYLKNNGREYINKVTGSENAADRKAWSELAESFSAGIKKAFSEVKHTNVKENKRYLIHDSLEFIKEGAYKLKTSAGADKAKFLINYTSKIILFPLTAGVTIWAIPKIMKLIFPNHKKTKAKEKAAMQKAAVKQNNPAQKTEKTSFKGSQVAFKGGLSSIAKIPGQIYEKGYKTPLASGLSKIFDWVAGSKMFAKRVDYLLSKSEITKYGMKILDRDKSGKILAKWDNDFIASNLPQIAAIFGSCLYIFNTIRNKEIEPERKPTLCTNMAVVAIFSLLAGKAIDKISSPIFEVLKKTHSRLMDNKLNYDHQAAWKCAQSLLTTTFAFRYLGPVLATPIADKLVKLFNMQETKKG